MTEERLKEIVESLLPNKQVFVVELKLSLAGGTGKVNVTLDSDEGISIEECAEVSRQLGGIIEEEELITTAYNLEVSSPGLDQPFKLERQYVKNIGRDVRVLLRESSAEVLGKLEGVKEEGIEIREQKKTKNKGKKSYADEAQYIPFSEIQKTNILIQF